MKKRSTKTAGANKPATAEDLMRIVDAVVNATPFQGYSPFVTYSDPTNGELLDRMGRPVFRNSSNPDAEALWRIGRDAYQLLGVQDREDYVKRYESFQRCMSMWRELLADMADAGRMADQHGKPLNPNLLALKHRTEAEILALTVQIFDQLREMGEIDVVDELRGEHLLFACLREIDNAIIGMELDGRGSVSSVVSAMNALSDAQAELNGSPQLKKVRRRMAYEAAVARHQKDPKAADKKLVFECYREWRANPSRYKSKAEFARDMLEKCQHLKSHKKIEDWVRGWDAVAKSGTLPAE